MAKHEILDQITQMIGLPSAIILTRRYGGRSLSVPTVENLHDRHPLVLNLGLEPAKKVSRMFGGETINLPNEVNAIRGERNKEIVRIFVNESRSVRDLSIYFGLDRRLIQTIIDGEGHRALRISRSNQVNAARDLRNREIVRLFVKENRGVLDLSTEFGLNKRSIQMIIDKAGYRQLRISRSTAIVE